MGNVILENISKAYGENTVCTDINLSINKGEFFTFLGPSGCGKTTILRIIAGFIRPQTGKVSIGGKDITNIAAEKRKVGMVFQNYALFPFMSVAENVEYGLNIKKIPRKGREEKVQEYLDLVRLGGYGGRNISELSGGEQQRVALARSLAIEPQVLLLDEPLSNLDARLRDKMRFEIKELVKKLGITTIFVTHDQTEALTMSDRIAVFEKGRCIQVGTPREVYSSPRDSFVARFIGGTNLCKAKVSSGTAALDGGIVLALENESEGEYISIRPQDIKLEREDKKGENIISGVVKDIQLNGFAVEYEVEARGNVFKVAELNTSVNDYETSVADQVSMVFDSKSIKVLEK